MIEYVHFLGDKGLCITDHESITAHLDVLKYYDSVKDKEGWEDFKIGLGNEIYLCNPDVCAENIGYNTYPHFILIALNNYGHKGIRELSTKAWTKNSFMHVMYRVPTYYDDLEEMLAKYKGNIIGSTACLGGALPRRLLLYRDNPTEDIWNSCVAWIEYMNEIFGDGYFFLELQPSDNEEQIYVNQKLIELSLQTNTPYLISTDAHYLKKEDRPIHSAFLKSQDGDREVDEFYNTTYMLSEEEIHEYMDKSIGFTNVQKGIENTMLVYDKIEPYKLTKDLEIPYIPLNTKEPEESLFSKYKDKIPLLNYFYNSKYDSDRHLAREILSGIEQDIYYQTEKAFEKIEECLKAIKISSEKMKVRWSAYVLQVADYVKIAWDSGTIVGAGRGSGIGFCILNILGITQINPLRENTQTYYWRFLNPERASVLDIDIDIEGSKREAVVQGLKEVYGEDRVTKVMTLSTEKSKSAILTAARGLGIDNDTSQYIASLIVYDRGNPRSLKTMYYGDEDNKPVADFVREMDARPELWEVAQKIEGLVCGVGSHAGGIIIVDKPFTETTALMKTKSGDIITQFDLHMCEDCSLIKIDLLSIDALDKIHTTLDLLLKDGKIEWQGSLRATYEKYLGVYTLERQSEEMWKMLWKHKVISFFQMEKESGKQAISLSKPHSVDDLAALNSVMRLMAQEKNGESPLNKYARFKNDITQWYDEMSFYGLTSHEQDILKEILGTSYGICEAQELLFLLVMHPEIGGFSLAWADKLRKSVAKKNPKDFEKLQKEFFQNAKDKNLSKNLVHYVWFVLIYMQRGLVNQGHVKLSERMQKRCMIFSC
jgi:DNA polymerase-3 subunit alpha